MSKHICMAAGAITPSVLQGAVLASELHWEMPLAQLFALIAGPMWSKKIEVDAEVVTKEIMQEPLKYTLFGLPIMISEDYPDGWIRLYAGNKMLYHIDACAVPVQFGYNAKPERSWEQYLVDQENKAKLIWDATAFEDLPEGTMKKHRARRLSSGVD